MSLILWKAWTSTYVSYIEANSYTAAIRNAISLGGDADTMACMAGGIAIATKGMEMPEDLAYYIYNHVLDDYLRHVLYEFNQLSPLKKVKLVLNVYFSNYSVFKSLWILLKGYLSSIKMSSYKVRSILLIIRKYLLSEILSVSLCRDYKD